MHWIEDKRGYVLKRLSGPQKETEYVLGQVMISDLDGLAIKQTDVPIIIELVESLFSHRRRAYGGREQHLSIVHRFNFERYFRNRIFEYDLSNKLFTQSLTLSLEEIQKQIVKWVDDGKKPSVVRRFTDLDLLKFESKEEFEKLVHSIFFLANYKEQDGSGFQVSYYDRDLLDKLSDYQNRISNRFYNGSVGAFQDFVRARFKSAELPFMFESGFLNFVIRGYFDHFVLPLDEVQNQCVEYLSTYLKSMETLDDTCWELYHRCEVSERVDTGSNSFQVRRSKHSEAIKVIIEFITENALDEFLLQIVSVEIRDQETFAVSTVILEMFGSFDKFDEYLAEQDVDTYKYIDEFREFLNKFKESGAEKYIPFEFNVIPVGKKIQERL